MRKVFRFASNNLKRQTGQLQGQLPLVHGDTRFFKLGKPIYGLFRLLPNLSRNYHGGGISPIDIRLANAVLS